jgi:hypothetical protein
MPGDAWLVCEPEERRVVQALELRRDRRVDLRFAVTVHGHPERGHPVQVAPSVAVDEMNTLTAGDHQRLITGPERVLGERMPHRREIASDQ